jgi:hypothetical protein
VTNKVEQLLNHAPTNITIYTKSVTPASQPIEPANKYRRLDVNENIVYAENYVVIRTENSDDEWWLTIYSLNKKCLFTLSMLDKDILQNVSYLNDKHISFAQD